MHAAISQSKRLLVLTLALLTVATGLSLLQLINSPAANAAVSVAAGEPKAGVTCDVGFSGCQGTIGTSGGSVPNNGGVITTPGGGGPAGNGFSFMLPCLYGVVDSTGASYGTSGKYPINAKTTGDAAAKCGEERGHSVTSRTQPPKYSGQTGGNGQMGDCDGIIIDGKPAAAIGIINATAGWTKVPNSRPQRWEIKFSYTCVYPSHNANYFANKWQRWCLMNNASWHLFYSTNASTAKAEDGKLGSGNEIDNRFGVDPIPPFKASDAKDCSKTLEDTWKNYKLPQATDEADGYEGPKYGFYRFTISGYEIFCNGQDPEAWTGGKKTSSCDPATKKPLIAHTNYTYTCNSTGFEKTAPDQSDAKYFRPAGCIDFTCNIATTLIAQQQPSTLVSVLRNGEQTNTRIGNFTVTGNRLVAGSVKNKAVKLNTVAGSSPNNPAVGTNSDDEWFRIMNQVTGQRMNFDEWQPLASDSTRLKAGLIFYWASDPDERWQMRQSYKFDAKYRVYRQDRVEGSAYLATISQPNKVCPNTTLSPKVNVLRSISQASN